MNQLVFQQNRLSASDLVSTVSKSVFEKHVLIFGIERGPSFWKKLEQKGVWGFHPHDADSADLHGF
jgi:hypothetical protein